MIEIYLDKDLDDRLNALAKATKLSKDFHIRKAIASHLGKFEQVYPYSSSYITLETSYKLPFILKRKKKKPDLD